MSQYCDVCGDSYKEKLKSRDTARNQAQQQANASQKAYALYEETPGNWQYIEAAIAYSTGIAVREVVY